MCKHIAFELEEENLQIITQKMDLQKIPGEKCQPTFALKGKA